MTFFDDRSLVIVDAPSLLTVVVVVVVHAAPSDANAVQIIGRKSMCSL